MKSSFDFEGFRDDLASDIKKERASGNREGARKRLKKEKKSPEHEIGKEMRSLKKKGVLASGTQEKLKGTKGPEGDVEVEIVSREGAGEDQETLENFEVVDISAEIPEPARLLMDAQKASSFNEDKKRLLQVPFRYEDMAMDEEKGSNQREELLKKHRDAFAFYTSEKSYGQHAPTETQKLYDRLSRGKYLDLRNLSHVVGGFVESAKKPVARNAARGVAFSPTEGVMGDVNSGLWVHAGANNFLRVGDVLVIMSFGNSMVRQAASVPVADALVGYSKGTASDESVIYALQTFKGRMTGEINRETDITEHIAYLKDLIHKRETSLSSSDRKAVGYRMEADDLYSSDSELALTLFSLNLPIVDVSFPYGFPLSLGRAKVTWADLADTIVDLQSGKAWYRTYTDKEIADTEKVRENLSKVYKLLDIDVEKFDKDTSDTR